MSHLHATGASLRFKNLLVVIKQTAFEEYTQVRCYVTVVCLCCSSYLIVLIDGHHYLSIDKNCTVLFIFHSLTYCWACNLIWSDHMHAVYCSWNCAVSPRKLCDGRGWSSATRRTKSVSLICSRCCGNIKSISPASIASNWIVNTWPTLT